MARTLIVLIGSTSFMLLMIKLSDTMTFSWSGFVMGVMWGVGFALLLLDWFSMKRRKEESHD